MGEDYTDCYRQLGVHPQASWEEIRRAYRQAMRRWHPDRHVASADPRQAEEKAKEIARAYRRLAHYYRQHGRLPPYRMPDTLAASDAPERTIRPRQAGAPRTAASGREQGGSRGSHSAQPAAVRSRFGSLALALAALAALGLFIFGRPSPTPPSAVSEEIPLAAATFTPPETSATPRFFTIGSSPQEVYAAQGIPDRMEKDTWHYGTARVYFVDGKVDRWETTPDQPLRVTLAPAPEAASGQSVAWFTLGSSKAQVRAVQGPPTREQDRVWEYGSARVYFDESGRVSGWDAPPWSALRARR